ncbi:hypothetical protein UT300003_34970 [Clostridium sardiniense]
MLRNNKFIYIMTKSKNKINCYKLLKYGTSWDFSYDMNNISKNNTKDRKLKI